MLPFQLPSKVDWAAQGLVATRVIGRLASGISLSQASADLATLAAPSNSAIPAALARVRNGLRVQVTPLQERLVGDIRPSLLALLTAVLFVLLYCMRECRQSPARTRSQSQQRASYPPRHRCGPWPPHSAITDRRRLPRRT